MGRVSRVKLAVVEALTTSVTLTLTPTLTRASSRSKRTQPALGMEALERDGTRQGEDAVLGRGEGHVASFRDPAASISRAGDWDWG